MAGPQVPLIGSINGPSTEVEKYPESRKNDLIVSGNQEERELTAILYEIRHPGEQGGGGKQRFDDRQASNALAAMVIGAVFQIQEGTKTQSKSVRHKIISQPHVQISKR